MTKEAKKVLAERNLLAEILSDPKRMKKVVQHHLERIQYFDWSVNCEIRDLKKGLAKKWDRVHARDSIISDIHNGNRHRRLLSMNPRKIPKIALEKEDKK